MAFPLFLQFPQAKGLATLRAAKIALVGHTVRLRPGIAPAHAGLAGVELAAAALERHIFTPTAREVGCTGLD
jgi:hypothetical protein